MRAGIHSHSSIDLSKLTDEQLEQLVALYGAAAVTGAGAVNGNGCLTSNNGHIAD